MQLVALAALVAGASAANHQVLVGTGNPVFNFNPSNITAALNDTVEFIFAGSPGNHSVTQSSFATPCTPLSGGFDSGTVFVPAGLDLNTTTPASFNLTITNITSPIWFYCKQDAAPSSHCGLGMVGSINAATSGSKTFAAFHAAALAIGTTAPKQTAGTSLTGVGAAAAAPAGPLASPSAASNSTASGTGSGTPSPTATPNAAAGFAGFVSVSFGALVAAGVAAGVAVVFA